MAECATSHLGPGQLLPESAEKACSSKPEVVRCLFPTEGNEEVRVLVSGLVSRVCMFCVCVCVCVCVCRECAVLCVCVCVGSVHVCVSIVVPVWRPAAGLVSRECACVCVDCYPCLATCLQVL